MSIAFLQTNTAPYPDAGEKFYIVYTEVLYEPGNYWAANIITLGNNQYSRKFKERADAVKYAEDIARSNQSVYILEATDVIEPVQRVTIRKL